MKELVVISGKGGAENTDVNATDCFVTEKAGIRERVEATQRYSQSCRTDFWRKVFQVELGYLLQHLEESKTVLSVGCGPAIIETGLSERGFHVTGLDISQEALECVPDHIRTIAARAEDMNFPEACFDAVVYVASLQFVEDYRRAVEKTAHALCPPGKLIVMLLNPESAFFKEKVRNPVSYVSKIKHTKLEEIEREIAKHFFIQTEYFMGLKDGDVFESQNSNEAALYIIRGTRKALEKDMVQQ